jgi:glycosyltransferase involved in cell wall biosynthesis
MNDTVCILTHSLYDRGGKDLQIGGVQTYTAQLAELLATRGSRRVVVVQPSAIPFIREDGSGVVVQGIPGGRWSLRKHYRQNYRNRAALTIFVNFSFAIWGGNEPTIAIQHGIHHDGFYSPYRGLVRTAHKGLAACLYVGRMRRIKATLDRMDRIICVDLNFPNWARAHFPLRRREDRLVYVPNFGVPLPEDEIARKLAATGGPQKVLIARRFAPERGFPMIGKIIAEIAPEYPEHRFLFAGSGVMTAELRRDLQPHANCEIARLSRATLHEVYRDCSVSVIPTLWSEGTSLSCIESMCHGLAVVATNVGGLGNIILGGFNGELVAPVEREIKAGIRRILDNREYARTLAYNGWLTAKTCFSLEAWRERVTRVLDSLGYDKTAAPRH